MGKILVVLAIVFFFACSSTNKDTDDTKGDSSVVEDDMEKRATQTTKDSENKFNDFFSSVRELGLPVSYKDFADYFIKEDQRNYYYSLNHKMLVNKKIYFCKGTKADIVNYTRVVTPETTDDVVSNIENEEYDEPVSFFIPIFKMVQCKILVLGYLTYIVNEGGSRMASLELVAYNTDGELLTEHPIPLFYEGGGEDGTVAIASTITSDCLIKMKRADETYTIDTESGDIEILETPKIVNSNLTYKISDKGILEIE